MDGRRSFMGAPGSDRARVIAACGQAVGEGAERPGLARCVLIYRFDEAGRSARSFSTRSPAVGLDVRALPDLRRRPCERRRGADMSASPTSGPHPTARGEQAEAIHRPPRGPPGLYFVRASSLDHSPPPSRNVDPTPSPPTGWEVLCARFERCSGDGGLKIAEC